MTYRFATGGQQTSYREYHANQPSKDVDTEVNLYSTDFGVRLNLLGSFLVADAKIEYSGPVISANTSDTVTFLNYEGRLLLNVKANPLALTFTAEYFSDGMTASDSTFGYQTMTGARFAVIAYSPMPILGFDLSFYYPFWVQIAGRTEYGATLTWRPSRGGEEGVSRLPNEHKGFFIEFGYYQKNILFEELVRPIKIRTITSSVKMGVTF